MLKKLLSPYYIFMGGSLILGFVASKIQEHNENEALKQKVDQAIINACVKVGMLEIEGGDEND